MIFGPAMGIISHWFKKRRGVALGLTATGSSIGGTIFPIATKRLINEVGFVEVRPIFRVYLAHNPLGSGGQCGL